MKHKNVIKSLMSLLLVITLVLSIIQVKADDYYSSLADNVGKIILDEYGALKEVSETEGFYIGEYVCVYDTLYYTDESGDSINDYRYEDLIQWHSSDDNILQFIGDNGIGNFIVNGFGTVTITATIGEKSDSITIKVNKPKSEEDNKAKYNKDGSLAYFDDGIFYIYNGVLESYNGKDETVVIPDGVTTIGKYVFHSNKTVKKVILSDTVTSIGMYAFAYSSIEKIVGIEHVTTFDDGVFYATKILENFEKNKKSESDVFIINNVVVDGGARGNVIIPNGVTGIANGTFELVAAGPQDDDDCLHSITIPKSVKYIGETAFRASNLERFYVVYVYEGSYAQQFFKKHNMNYKIVPSFSSSKSKAVINKVKVPKSITLEKNKSKIIKVSFPKGYSSKNFGVYYWPDDLWGSALNISTKNGVGKISANKKGNDKLIVYVDDRFGNIKVFTVKVTIK